MAKKRNRRSKSKITTISMSELADKLNASPADVVKVAQEIAGLNQRQGQIEQQLSDLGVKTAALNTEFRGIQLKRTELQRRFDTVSRPG